MNNEGEIVKNNGDFNCKTAVYCTIVKKFNSCNYYRGGSRLQI